MIKSWKAVLGESNFQKLMYFVYLGYSIQMNFLSDLHTVSKFTLAQQRMVDSVLKPKSTLVKCKYYDLN